MSRIIPDLLPASDRIPESVDVVVIGGGIAGVSTALALAESGISVALCEKGIIGAEQSGRNWGWVRQAGRDPREIPLGKLSLALWRGLNGRIGEETGFRQEGTFYLSRNAAQEVEYEDLLPHAREHGIESHMLRGAQLSAALPGLAGKFLSGMHTPSDGRAEPLKAAPAIARGAMKAGAYVFTSCAVRSIERSGGRVSGVVTEKGRIGCSSVVLAGGAWSRLFAGNLDLDFPQLKVLSSAARTTPVSGVPDSAVGADNFSLRRRLDGGFTIARRNRDIAPIVPDSFSLFFDFAPNLIQSWAMLKLRVGDRFIQEWRTPRKWDADEITPFERVRILDPQPVESLIRQGYSNLVKAFPAFAEARIVQQWAGLIDVTPDAVPVIGPVESIPGFFICSGFSGHGFGVGPGAGQLMAEIVMGGPTSIDPSPFRLDRFKRSAQ